MYGSREDELAMLKLQQKVEDILKNNMDELVKRKNLMTGITPIVINKFDPEEHRVDIMNMLKNIIKQTPDNSEVTRAYVYLKESDTIEEFYRVYNYFIKHLRYKRNLNFNQFKTEWDAFYSILLKGDALNKPLLLKDVNIDTQKEYEDVYNRLIRNKEKEPKKEPQKEPEKTKTSPKIDPAKKKIYNETYKLKQKLKELDAKPKTKLNTSQIEELKKEYEDITINYPDIVKLVEENI